jgi:hypothetical protein
MKLETLDDQLMASAAHRYCLGRRSYIVGACLEWLQETWEQFDRNTRRVMVRDTIEALMDDLAGGVTDVAGWRDFATFGFSRLNNEDQKWVREAVAYKDKPWPIEEPTACPSPA